MELLIHSAEAAGLVAALYLVHLYSRTEDLTFLVAAVVCAICAGLSFVFSWPWLLAAGAVITALLLIVTAGGRGKD